ncbi:MAG: protein translocase subunit SecD [Deltaproteobacteria bacterium]|nr:protein translocase subunit SecD [Deltaproteobacteria bacterium]
MDKSLQWRAGVILFSILAAVYFLYPVQGHKINLGLDLQGGMHLILGVQVDKAVDSELDRMVDEFQDLLDDKGIDYVLVEKVGNVLDIETLDRKGIASIKQVVEESYAGILNLEEHGENHISLTLKPKEIQRIKRTAIDQSLETIRNRVDEFGVSEPTIQREGRDRILIQLPGLKDTARAKALIGKTARLEFKLVDEEHDVDRALQGDMPMEDEILYERNSTGNKTPLLLKKRVLMTGDTITDARVSYDRFNAPYVSLTFNRRGAKLFGKLTAKYVKKRMAIILDGTVYSAPTIRERIAGGRAQISGRFSLQEAKDLAIVLRAGALPAPVTIEEERTVGPSLGQDSIKKGMKSIIIGGILVVVFMVIYYKVAGLVANVALILNLLFMMAALSGLNATLTLPGIAGIILTIGMAVDANVIIFERIREELRQGKTVLSSVEGGYDKAFSTILDANVTTLIAAFVLFQFGTGPVKGFAVTLCLGIIASMFTAIFITRVIFAFYLGKREVEHLSI